MARARRRFGQFGGQLATSQAASPRCCERSCSPGIRRLLRDWASVEGARCHVVRPASCPTAPKVATDISREKVSRTIGNCAVEMSVFGQLGSISRARQAVELARRPPDSIGSSLRVSLSRGSSRASPDVVVRLSLSVGCHAHGFDGFEWACSEKHGHTELWPWHPA